MDNPANNNISKQEPAASPQETPPQDSLQKENFTKPKLRDELSDATKQANNAEELDDI